MNTGLSGLSGLSGLVGGGSSAPSLPAGFVRHYKKATGQFQDAAKTTAAGETDPVRVWADQAGNSDIVASADANRPVVEDGGCAFTAASSHHLSETAPTRPASFTISIKLHLDDVTVRQFVCGAGNSGLGVLWGDVEKTSAGDGKLRTRIQNDLGNQQVEQTDNQVLTSGVAAVVTMRYVTGQGRIEMWVDGVVAPSTLVVDDSLTANSGAANNWSLGRCGDFDGLYFTGTAYEYARYASALSDGDRTALDAYMATV